MDCGRVYRRHEWALRPRGARGRHHTEQDLKYHTEFSSGALATGIPHASLTTSAGWRISWRLEAYRCACWMSHSNFLKLFAGGDGNRHVLGVRIVSDTFELSGWSVECLAADTPTEALLKHADATNLEALGLSTSIVQQLPALQRLVEVVRTELGEQRPIVLVGGLATNQFDDVWRWLGADLWSPDAAQAVQELR